MSYTKSTKSATVPEKWQFILIECQIYGEQYNGSTKTKSRSRENNYKSTQRKFLNKEAVPRQA